jgi:hypothetical protein
LLVTKNTVCWIRRRSGCLVLYYSSTSKFSNVKLIRIGRSWRIRPARWSRAGFRKFSKKISCIARARRCFSRTSAAAFQPDPPDFYFLKKWHGGRICQIRILILKMAQPPDLRDFHFLKWHCPRGCRKTLF